MSQAVADDGAGLVPARHEDGHRRRSSRRTRFRAGSVAGDSQAAARRASARQLQVLHRRHAAADYAKARGCPGIIWFYPTEFSTQPEYDQRRRTTNINQFANVAARSPEIWVTQGYVVIQPVDIPIVGPTGRMNDHYVDELREDLDLTIDAVDKAGLSRSRPPRHRRPQLRRVQHDERDDAHAVLQGGHRRRRHVQPHAHAVQLPERAAHVLGSEGHVRRDVAVLLCRSVERGGAHVPLARGPERRHGSRSSRSA